jgi:hypothetical protein
MNHHTLLTQIGDAIADLKIHRAGLQLQAARLRKLEPVEATASWKKDVEGQERYLYLYHPMRKGKRRREYIGAKKKAQDQALARIQAHLDLIEIEAEIAKLTQQLNKLGAELRYALTIARRN